MKLQSAVSLILVLGVVGFAGMVDSLCLIRNTIETKVYWYQCSMSTNYSSDLASAPIDVPKISFCTSKMGVIRNRSFARFSNGLEILQIYFSEIGEIENNAFGSLAKLHTLEIVGTNLQIVKGAWFNDLTKLKAVSFRDNEIKSIENSFFSTLPKLTSLDLSENKLTCLPVDSFAGFHTQEFRVSGNPFTLVCLVQLTNWLKDKNVWNVYTGRNNIEIPYELLDTCVKKLSTPQLDEEILKNCIETTLMDFLLPQANYTMGQLCQSLKDKPTPFLDCSM